MATGDWGSPSRPSGHLRAFPNYCTEDVGCTKALWLRCSFSPLFFSRPTHFYLSLIAFFTFLYFTVKLCPIFSLKYLNLFPGLVFVKSHLCEAFPEAAPPSLCSQSAVDPPLPPPVTPGAAWPSRGLVSHCPHFLPSATPRARPEESGSQRALDNLQGRKGENLLPIPASLVLPC